MWIKSPNSGRVDTMLTLGVYSTVIVLAKFLFSELSVGPVTFGQLDAGVVAAILTPTLGAYCARRYSDSKVQKDQPKKDKDEAPK